MFLATSFIYYPEYSHVHHYKEEIAIQYLTNWKLVESGRKDAECRVLATMAWDVVKGPRETDPVLLKAIVGIWTLEYEIQGPQNMELQKYRVPYI